MEWFVCQELGALWAVGLVGLKTSNWRDWCVCFVCVLKGPDASSSWRDQVVCGCVRGLSAGSWRDLCVLIFPQ